MENHTTSDNQHKTILKATGVFGFMQVLKMLISIIGSKFVAIFLGPIGIGTFGLLTNTLNIITSISSFGLATTSVREIAVAASHDDKEKLSETISVLQQIAFFTGILASLLTIVCSKFLSQLTFGSTTNYYWFIILSFNFIISGLATLRSSILQGNRMLKIIAISNIVLSLLVTICTIIIYYFLKFDGIIWVILASSTINLLVNFYFTKGFKSKLFMFSFSEFIRRAKPILQLGFLLSLNSIFGLICTYIIKIYLNKNGASAQILGFYEVSTVLLLSYVGMIFNAMSVDFYPQLTAVNQDNNKVKNLVNNQLEIALLLLTPALILLYLIAPFAIELLYTKDFHPVFLILKAALFAMIIKAIIWPLGYIILAKGNKKQYFKQELVSDFLNVSLTILFYHFFGLEGIGFAMVLNYLLYGIYVLYIVQRDYGFGFRKDCLGIILFSLVIGISAVITIFFMNGFFAKIVLGVLLLISVLYSYFGLDKRVSIYGFWISIKNRLFKNK